jgi:hypothetical protein
VAIPVNTVAAGGIAVVDVTATTPNFGAPVSEALPGKGTAVTKVTALGVPVTFTTILAAPPLTLATFDGTPQLGAVVSNGNLTVTHGSTSSNAGVISTMTKTSGKFYFELTVQVATSSSNCAGITSGTIADMGNNLNSTQILTGASTIIYSNDASTAKNLGTTAVGDVFGFAIDLTARLGWIRRNAGTWNADAAADPATGVNGVVIEAGSFAPAVRFSNAAATTAAFTGNFGQGAFVNAAPAGFSNWGV